MQRTYRSYAQKAEKAYYDGKISFVQLHATRERADVVSVHKTLRETAKKYGWDYTRKRTV